MSADISMYVEIYNLLYNTMPLNSVVQQKYSMLKELVECVYPFDSYAGPWYKCSCGNPTYTNKHRASILGDEYVFCSEWCRYDVEYDLQKSYCRRT